MRCLNCALGKRGCSFKDYDFGIIGPPSLKKTEAGNLRRAEQVLAKQKGSLKKATAEEDTSVLNVVGQSASTLPMEKGVDLRAPEMRKAASEGSTVLPVAIRQVQEHERDTSMVVAQDVGSSKARIIQGSSYVRMSGRDERLFFEDILRFEEIATSPSCSLGKLSLARVELNSIAIRERMQVNALEAFTMDRSGVMDDILNQMGERIKAMAGKLRELQPIPDPAGYHPSDDSDDGEDSTVKGGSASSGDKEGGAEIVPME